MHSLKTCLHKIKDTVYARSEETIRNLTQALVANLVDSTKGQQQHISFPDKRSEEINNKISQQMLEIDVIESGYILKTEENIASLTHSKNQLQLSDRSKQPREKHKSPQSHSRLKDIEEQKRAILEELKQLDNQIAEIKGQKVQDLTVKRKEKEEQSQEAKKKAKQLVRQLKLQKKEIEQKKRKEAQKSLLILKQQEQQFRRKRFQQILRAKQQKRKAIEARMEEQKRKREQRKLIDKESNKLIKQLKKEEQIIKQKQELPHDVIELELKKKIISKKQQINFKEIQQHERNYMIMKEQDRSLKKDRSESLGRPIPKYPKNMWIDQLEEQQLKKKEEEKIKETIKKIQLEKRKKYGELVKNIFIPKTKKETINEEIVERVQQKPQTPEAFVLPKIAESDKRVTDSKPMRKFMDQNRPFATAHPKPPKPKPQQIKPKQPEDQQKLKQKKLKQIQLRRQTKQRLKKLQNRSMQVLTKSKPKYQNYLGQLKSKLGNQAQSWKKVIDNENMSKEDKYKEMVRRAQALQNKAKAKEEVRKQGDQDALNLYIGSIQAKLAILQKF